MIRAVILDLCDTVVRAAGHHELLRLPGLGERWDARQLDAWFQATPEYFAYERGQIDTDTFLRCCCEGLGARVSSEQFAEAYQNLVLHEIPGMADLVARLAGAFPLYALSNNNPLLWQAVRRVSPSVGLFRRVFLSHETGHLKPEPAAYEHALTGIGLGLREVVLVDDSRTSVARARSMGLSAIRFSSPGQALCELRDHIRYANVY